MRSSSESNKKYGRIYIFVVLSLIITGATFYGTETYHYAIDQFYTYELGSIRTQMIGQKMIKDDGKYYIVSSDSEGIKREYNIEKEWFEEIKVGEKVDIQAVVKINTITKKSEATAKEYIKK